jgi:hypothetical protein
MQGVPKAVAVKESTPSPRGPRVSLSPAATPAAKPPRLDDFSLIRVLGRGNFGKVSAYVCLSVSLCVFCVHE